MQMSTLARGINAFLDMDELFHATARRLGLDYSDPATRRILQNASGDGDFHGWNSPQTLIAPPAPPRAAVSTPAPEVQPPRSANEKYSKEFALLKDEFKAAGLSEADYIAQRRIDDGLDTLEAQSAPTMADSGNWLTSELNRAPAFV